MQCYVVFCTNYFTHLTRETGAAWGVW